MFQTLPYAVFLSATYLAEQRNFEKYPGITFNLPYDYNSIMHYGFNDFSKDGVLPTMLPKKKGANIGNRELMSELDVQRINILYHCNSHSRDEQKRRGPTRRRDNAVDFGKLFDSMFNSGDSVSVFVFGNEAARNNGVTLTSNKALE